MQATPTLQPKKLWQKKIPTIIGLGFLVVALAVGIIFMGKGAGVFAPRATPETTPKNVRLTNVTDTTFTVSFTTDASTTATVLYGTDEKKTDNTVPDDRVQISASSEAYTTHHITLHSATPATTYYYIINVDGAKFDNNGAVFKVTTAKRGGTPTATKTVYGSVTSESGGPAAGALVYLKIEGAGDMSTLVTNTGSWGISLSNARTADGTGYATITDDTVLNLSAQGTKSSQVAQASTTVANFQQASAMTFGSTTAQAPATLSPTATPAATPDTTAAKTASGDGTLASTATGSAQTNGGLNNLLSGNEGTTSTSGASSAAKIAEVTTLDLTKPVTAKTVINTDQPVISGKVAPNVKVTIQVHSNEAITQEVTSDSSGNFEMDLKELEKSLEPGTHTVTYTYNDPATGQPKAVTKTFTVAAPATKTIALAPTATPNPYGTTNPYPIGGATDSATTVEESPASTTSTKTKTATKSSTRKNSVSTSSGLPVSGAVGTTLALVFGGLFFIIAGTWSYWVASQFAKEKS